MTGKMVRMGKGSTVWKWQEDEEKPDTVKLDVPGLRATAFLRGPDAPALQDRRAVEAMDQIGSPPGVPMSGGEDGIAVNDDCSNMQSFVVQVQQGSWEFEVVQAPWLGACHVIEPDIFEPMFCLDCADDHAAIDAARGEETVPWEEVKEELGLTEPSRWYRDVAESFFRESEGQDEKEKLRRLATLLEHMTSGRQPKSCDCIHIDADPQLFLVWKDGGGRPTKAHESFGSAQKEAERLAKANPGERFYVLYAIGNASRLVADVQWVVSDARFDDRMEIPF